MGNKNTLSVWAVNQSLGFSLGWLFHGIFSHLFTGEHEAYLSVPQVISHTLSLTGMALIFLFFQNRATMQLFGVNLFRHWGVYLILPTLLFWVGYYTVAPPVDLVLSFISFSTLNGIYLTKELQLKRWTLYSVLSSIAGIIIGTVIITPVEPAVLPMLSGLTKHIIIFLIEGTAVAIPMAITGGWLLRKTITGKR